MLLIVSVCAAQSVIFGCECRVCQLIILDHIDALCNRTKQRIYFLRHLLRSFGVRKHISEPNLVLHNEF